MPSREDYLIGKLGSYEVATIAKVDSHLRALRQRLTARVVTSPIGPKVRIAIWADMNALLDRRSELTEASCKTSR